jgi:hypothetical protein
MKPKALGLIKFIIRQAIADKDRGLNKTRNLILESAAESNFLKLKIWFYIDPFS